MRSKPAPLRVPSTFDAKIPGTPPPSLSRSVPSKPAYVCTYMYDAITRFLSPAGAHFNSFIPLQSSCDNQAAGSTDMPIAQLRSPRLASQLAWHVKAARQFSTGATLRKELQDAYILSASRTPTAKVRLSLSLFIFIFLFFFLPGSSQPWANRWCFHSSMARF